MNDHLPLTARQLAVLHAVCNGPSVEESAYQLFIQPCTLKNHLTAIYQKLIAAGEIRSDTRQHRTSACLWLYRHDQAEARR